MGDLVNLPDGRLFLCNGAQQGGTMPHIHMLHPAASKYSELSEEPVYVEKKTVNTSKEFHVRHHLQHASQTYANWKVALL